MTQFKECVFKGSTVVLDGNEYIGCKFFQSRIVITRGNFILKDSSFDSCKFEFGGEAENIRNLVLSLLNQPSGPRPTGTGEKKSEEAEKNA